MRIGVIGVGIVGASIGWHLAGRGVDVVMIDAGQPGEGVTNWTFSWVNASNKTETRKYFDLNVAGLAAHAELATALPPGAWWHPSGLCAGSTMPSDRGAPAAGRPPRIVGLRRRPLGGRSGPAPSRACRRLPLP